MMIGLKQFENKEIFSYFKIKNTKQRNVVLDILKKTEYPLTSKEIFFRAKNMDDSINFSTIYRILNVFESKGIVVKLNIMNSDEAVFELKTVGHKHYLICLKCKKMIPIEGCPLGDYEKFIENTTDFDIMGHHLEIFGYCSECKGDKKGDGVNEGKN